MGIYIRGVDLPRDEWLDIRVRADGPSEAATKEHPYWREIEAVQVDEPDGGLISRSEKPTGSDLISRQDAIEAVEKWKNYDGDICWHEAIGKATEVLADLPSAETQWIPVRYHEITDEEREEEGYPKDWVYYLDCEMPSDEQEILVQVKNGEIRWDVCYEDDGFSLDSGWDWKDDIVAWMPMPPVYKDGEYERATEQMEHDVMYEPTYNQDDGSM